MGSRTIRNQSNSNSKKFDSNPSKSLLDFASPKDRLLVSIGLICAIGHGFRYIVFAVAIGIVGNVLTTVDIDKAYRVIEGLETNFSAFGPRNALNGFHSYSLFQQIYGLEVSVASIVTSAIYKMIAITGFVTVFVWLCFLGMSLTMDRAALNQVNRMRLAFVDSILKQDIQWFDTCQSSKFISQTENDFIQYQDGIGFKIGHLTSFLSAYFLPFIYSLILEWRLALVGYSTAPLFYLAYVFTTKIEKKYSADETKSYSNAGVVAEDVLTAFKTVIGANGQAAETKRYTQMLLKGKMAGLRKAMMSAVGHGLFLTTLLCSFALSGWYASHLYTSSPGYAEQKDAVFKLISITLLVNVAGIRISEIFGMVNYMSRSIISGRRILEVINKKPTFDCDTNLDNNKLFGSIEEIEFRDVEFSYISRENASVLKGFNLKILKGERVALVGSSGSGKSTVVSLLLRFYDPVRGSVLMNGSDIRSLNLGWLRGEMGVVGQEPVLFPTSIYENIRYGFHSATQADIESAAKMANAHEFIMSLPQRYETQVGDGGTQMSGGQKQRIAIARALVRRPSVLLLDEATSALDSHSEAIVQKALDNVSIGRTSIIIAHRLSTIRNADKIVVMDNGHVVECGTHDSLMNMKQLYYKLVRRQDESMVIEQEHSVNEMLNGVKLNLDEKNSSREIQIFDSSLAKKDVKPQFENVNKSQNKRPANKRSLKGGKVGLFDHWAIVRLMRLKGWGPWLILFGLFASLIQGIAYILIMAYVFPLINVIFENHNPNSSYGLNAYLSGLWQLGIPFVVADFFMVKLMGLSGTLIAHKLREKLFHALMRQEVAWYENSSSSVGSLCLILSYDVENIKSALSTHLSIIVTVFAQILTGLIIMYQMAWQYGCIMLICFLAVISLSVYMKLKLHKRFLKDAKIMQASNEILRDVVMNIRTIRFLHAEQLFNELYEEKTIVKLSKKKKIGRFFTSALSSVIDGFSQVSVVFIGLITPKLFLNNKIVLLNYFRAFGIAGLANSFSRSISAFPNVTSAMVSVEKIFKIIDRIPKIDNFSKEGIVLADASNGRADFEGISFSYPTRPSFLALSGFNLRVNSNQMVAIVGSSGSGKSTCVQLVARFYDPQSGSVFVCDEPVKKVNLVSLREKMAIVQQEPMVFNRSIAENIRYGDVSREVPMEEVIEAAKVARAHDFITALPQGYETLVGGRGTQLSGGEKQRIAIARAIIRRPKLLFLDEATSALDSETDKELQVSLRRHKDRMCIVLIAHRLSTITDADHIYVVDQGRVVEGGTHQRLMQAQGYYHRLYTKQIDRC